MLNEVTDGAGEIVLFIDEIHTVVGAGAGDGAMDASNLLKPALARGQLRCIGATTLDEYRQYIEKDAALERRFQQVYVDQPTVEATTAILRGLKERCTDGRLIAADGRLIAADGRLIAADGRLMAVDGRLMAVDGLLMAEAAAGRLMEADGRWMATDGRYELHHGVSISDGALVAAATLSDRYIADRFLPDKAIDLVDEAAAKLRIDATSRPELLDQVSRRLLQVSTPSRRRGGAWRPWAAAPQMPPLPLPLPPSASPLLLALLLALLLSLLLSLLLALRLSPPLSALHELSTVPPPPPPPLPRPQVQMEMISLQNEAQTDARAASRLRSLTDEAGRLQAQQSELSARWEAEKAALDAVRDLKAELENLNLEIEQAEQSYELSRAAELKYARTDPPPPPPPTAVANVSI